MTLPTSPQSFSAWKKTLAILKHLLHWIYSHKVDLRPYIRSQFGKHLLAVYADRGSSSSSPTGVGFNGRGSDAGNNRAHVAHLLEVLGTIISGFDGVHSRVQSICAQELLSQVIMPLHMPNEMIEWRDQVPVLQCYHEPLVRCLVKLIEHDRGGRDNAQLQQQQHLPGASDTLLVQAIKMLLKLWPDAYQTNTPKQVLLLHELEMLLELVTRAEFTDIVQPVMVRQHEWWIPSNGTGRYYMLFVLIAGSPDKVFWYGFGQYSACTACFTVFQKRENSGFVCAETHHQHGTRT